MTSNSSAMTRSAGLEPMGKHSGQIVAAPQMTCRELPNRFPAEVEAITPDSMRVAKVLSLSFLQCSLHPRAHLALLGRRFELFSGYWNRIDRMFVPIFFLDKLLIRFIAFNTQLVWLLRFVRILRILRLARGMDSFDALYLMTTALGGSASALCWAVVLILTIQMMNDLLLTQFLQSVYLSNVYVYFRSFSRAVFSMLDLTSANWPPISRLLAEDDSQWFMFSRSCTNLRLVSQSSGS